MSGVGAGVALSGAGSWDLVRAAQGGQREAFGQLYARYRPAVYRFVRGKVGDHALAEDLTSETFVRAWRGIGSVTEQQADPGAWLCTIARNLVLDHAKSARTRRERITAEVPEPRTAAEAGSGVEAEAEARAARWVAAVTVARGLEGLTPDQRRTVELYELTALRSLADTAAVMGRSPGAVKALRHRAVVAIREQLAVEGVTSLAECAAAAARAEAVGSPCQDRFSRQWHGADAVQVGVRGAA